MRRTPTGNISKICKKKRGTSVPKNSTKSVKEVADKRKLSHLSLAHHFTLNPHAKWETGGPDSQKKQ